MVKKKEVDVCGFFLIPQAFKEKVLGQITSDVILQLTSFE